MSAAMRSINSSGVRCSSSPVYLLHCAYLAARFAQPLQARAVLFCYAHAGVYRETAVLVAQHLFGLETLEQTTPNKGAQDAPAQAGLHLVHGMRIHAGGRVEDDTQQGGLIVGITLALTRLSKAWVIHERSDNARLDLVCILVFWIDQHIHFFMNNDRGH